MDQTVRSMPWGGWELTHAVMGPASEAWWPPKARRTEGQHCSVLDLSPQEGFLVDVEGPAPQRESSRKPPLAGIAIYSFCLGKM